MISFDETIQTYWNYYLEIENEFVQTKRYVDFNERNYNTFSIEFLKLYQAICSEIDVIGKTLASVINPSFKSDSKDNNIQKWWIELQDILNVSLNIGVSIHHNEDSQNIKDIMLHNYLIDKDYSPWKDYKLERYIDSDGKNRIKLCSNCSTPSWWSDYNKVKHQRTFINNHTKEVNYQKANLKNVCESLSALYLLEIALLEQLGDNDQIRYFINDSKVFFKNEKLVAMELSEVDEICKV